MTDNQISAVRMKLKGFQSLKNKYDSWKGTDLVVINDNHESHLYTSILFTFLKNSVGNNNFSRLSK